jgi:hypothetical protein
MISFNNIQNYNGNKAIPTFQLKEKGVIEQAKAHIARYDTDGDQQLNLQEFTAGGGLTGEASSVGEEALKGAFEGVAGDNTIDTRELLQAWLVMDNFLEPGDGKITQEETLAVYQHMANIYAQDANIPNAERIGKLEIYQQLMGSGTDFGLDDKLPITQAHQVPLQALAQRHDATKAETTGYLNDVESTWHNMLVELTPMAKDTSLPMEQRLEAAKLIQDTLKVLRELRKLRQERQQLEETPIQVAHNPITGSVTANTSWFNPSV